MKRGGVEEFKGGVKEFIGPPDPQSLDRRYP